MKKKTSEPAEYVVHRSFRLKGEGAVPIGTVVELDENDARLVARKVYPKDSPEAKALLGALKKREADQKKAAEEAAKAEA